MSAEDEIALTRCHVVRRTRRTEDRHTTISLT
jgi:hypothetical protein